MNKPLMFIILVGVLGSASFPLGASPIRPNVAKRPAVLVTAPVRSSLCTSGSPEKPLHFLESQSQSLDYCGACSDSQCQGAQRGSLCWLPGAEGGWGFCNVNAWAQWCTQWEWECICQPGSSE